MKKIILSLSFLAFISCSKPEFCGYQADQKEVENLNGKVEGTGFSLGINLSMEVSQKLGERKDVKFEILYSTKDTVVLNIINIPDEDFAKNISCIVKENKIIKDSKFSFATYNWQDKSKSFKY